MRETTTGTWLQTHQNSRAGQARTHVESPTSCPLTQEKGHCRPPSAPPRSLEHMLHCPQTDHNPHMSYIPFILA